MAGNTNHWKLGLFVVMGIGVGLGALVWLGASRLKQDYQIFYTYFDETVSGLSEGAHVKFRGMDIGTVWSIGTAPDRKHVKVALQIFNKKLEEFGLYDPEKDTDGPEPGGRNLRTQLITSILTGTAHIEADYFDPKRYPIEEYPFDPGPDVVYSVPSAMHGVEEGVVNTLDRLPALIDEATNLIRDAKKTMSGMDLAGLSERVERLLDSVQKQFDAAQSANLVETGTATLEEVRAGVTEVRELVSTLKDDGKPFQSLLKTYGDLGERIEKDLAAANLPETAQTTRATMNSIGHATDSVSDLARDLRSELNYLRRTLDSVKHLTDMLERDPGALIHGKTIPRLPETPR